MRRLALIGSWRRLGVQAGLLAGLGLAFVGSQEKPAGAGGQERSQVANSQRGARSPGAVSQAKAFSSARRKSARIQARVYAHA